MIRLNWSFIFKSLYYYEQLSISIPQLNTTTEMQFAEAVAFEDAKIITFLTTRFCH